MKKLRFWYALAACAPLWTPSKHAEHPDIDTSGARLRKSIKHSAHRKVRNKMARLSKRRNR